MIVTIMEGEYRSAKSPMERRFTKLFGMVSWQEAEEKEVSLLAGRYI